ncbi:MAG: hypothetical protein ACKO1T_02025 [Sediminibacterium sp.]
MLHLNRILPLLIENRKFIAVFTLVSTLIAAFILYYTPREYKSVATLTPINTQLADPARLFNPQIKDLYPLFGNGDDIERMESSEDWNNIYAELVHEFYLDTLFISSPKTQLTDSAKNARASAKRFHEAEEILQEKLFTKRTDNGQLQLIAWTKFPKISQDLVTAYAHKIERRIRAAWLQYYESNLSSLRQSLDSLEATYLQVDRQTASADHAQMTLVQLQKESLKQLISNNRIITGQWQQAKAALPGPLFILDPPRADPFSYRPKILLLMTGVCLGAIFFSSCLVLLHHRHKLS